MKGTHENFPLADTLTLFFLRLAEIDPIVRVIVRDSRASVAFVLRGEQERRVVLDLAREPLEVVLDDKTRPGTISVAIEASVLHQILLGRMKPGLALGRRQLLLRGSPIHFASFIPLFDFAPPLYREHLADLSFPGFERPGRNGRLPISRKETTMDDFAITDRPVSLATPSPVLRAVQTLIERAAWVSGYGIGLLRYRFLKNINLFDVMGAMSEGVGAAMGRSQENGGR